MAHVEVNETLHMVNLLTFSVVYFLNIIPVKELRNLSRIVVHKICDSFVIFALSFCIIADKECLSPSSDEAIVISDGADVTGG